MSILVDENTKLLIQGLGRWQFSSFKNSRIWDKCSCSVPGKEGTKFENKVPYFSSVEKGPKTEANTGVIFVPAPFAMDAIIEQVDAGINLIVCITEGVPVLDMIKIMSYIENKSVRLIGSNCPGLLTPLPN